jgi:hypothetical protein
MAETPFHLDEDHSDHPPYGGSLASLANYRCSPVLQADGQGAWGVRPVVELEILLPVKGEMPAGHPELGVAINTHVALSLEQAAQLGFELLQAANEANTDRGLMRWLIEEHGADGAGAAYSRHQQSILAFRAEQVGDEPEEETTDEHESEPSGQEAGSDAPEGDEPVSGPDAHDTPGDGQQRPAGGPTGAA